MSVKRFRKKPVEIEAIQWTGDNLKKVLEFAGKHPRWKEWFSSFEEYERHVKASWNAFRVFNSQGSTVALPGDWIIRESRECVYVCWEDIFDATYDEIFPESKVTNIEKNAPHVVINCGATVHVIPMSVIENIAHGSMSIMDVEMWEPIFRKILEEWLQDIPDDDEFIQFIFHGPRWRLHTKKSNLLEICRGERPILKDDDWINFVDTISQDWAKRKLEEFRNEKKLP